MKLRSLSRSLLISGLLLCAGTSCEHSGTAIKKEVTETLEARRFTAFAQKSNLVLPAEKQYYIIVQPKICVSCVGYYLREISSHIPKESKLIVIGKGDAQKEVFEYIDHPASEYFSNFNNNDLDREPFMKSGIAYAITNGNKVISVIAVNKSNLKSLRL